MANIGLYELIIPSIILLFLIFGAKRLPQIARSIADSIVEFRKGLSEGSSSSSDIGHTPDGREDE